MHRPPKKKWPGGNGSGPQPGNAEFRRDLAAFKARFGRYDDDGPPPADEAERDLDEALADLRAMRSFYAKHRRRLEAEGLNVGQKLAGFDAGILQAEAALAEEAETEERHLQAQANRADAEARMIVTLYKTKLFYESRTSADWDTQTPEQKAEMTTLLEGLRASLPAMLDKLPIAQRRELEALRWEDVEAEHKARGPGPAPEG